MMCEEKLEWTPDALEFLERVPAGPMRVMTRARTELLASKRGEKVVTLSCLKEKYEGWGESSRQQEMQLTWAPAVTERMSRIPEFIRGMLIKEMEAFASAEGLTDITEEFYEKQTSRWMEHMKFHHDS